jgi:gamma-carbonic anhydrase
MQPIILPYFEKTPQIDKNAFIAPGASIIGDVIIGPGSGVWFGSVIRGDVAYIRIGKNTNIQDGTVIHVTRGGYNTIIGDNVTVGHRVLLHACEIHNNAFIGMGAIVMDRAIIEPFSMVAAGSLVTNDKVIKTGEIWAGSPAKFFRKMTNEEIQHITISADNYKKHAEEYIKL